MVTSELKMGQRIATTSFADNFFYKGWGSGGEDGRILESPEGVQLKPSSNPYPVLNQNNADLHRFLNFRFPS